MHKLLFNCLIFTASVAIGAPTNVTTKIVTKMYSGKESSAETNITHSVSRHEALKQDMRRHFNEIDASLDLRESRKGYKGGEWSKKWAEEAAVWFEQQDWSKLHQSFEFVDSKGFRHLMAFSSADCRGSARAAKMAKQRAELAAKIAISRTWDAEVARVSAESRKQDANGVESLQSELYMSEGTHVGIVRLMVKEMPIAGQKKCIVVYGIMPQCMKF